MMGAKAWRFVIVRLSALRPLTDAVFATSRTPSCIMHHAKGWSTAAMWRTWNALMTWIGSKLRDFMSHTWTQERSPWV